MSIKLGDTAPNFQAESSVGDINFYHYLGDSWGILFSHPADYTPVCTTELGYTSNCSLNLMPEEYQSNCFKCRWSRRSSELDERY
jgi:alkyl hydroperoxide reductase subunit AhpC